MSTTKKELYRLPDGTQADPKDCEVGKDGVLRHKSGMAVVMTADGKPETIAPAADAEAAGAGEETKAK